MDNSDTRAELQSFYDSRPRSKKTSLKASAKQVLIQTDIKRSES